MFSNYLTLFKIIGVIAVLGAVAYFSYDYGVTSTNAAAQEEHNRLLDKLEAKENEAFQLAVELANQKPIIQTEYRTIEKKVLVYAQKNSDKQCVANDDEWLHIRADAVRAHNRAINIQSPATVADDATEAVDSSGYGSDAEVLAEDVANIQTCTENAAQLDSLQKWIQAQLPK